MCTVMVKSVYQPLALMAADEEDLEVLSAVLQDSIAKIGDIAYLPAERRFALVANRFVWEEGARRQRGPFARVRAGVHFDDVVAVKAKAVDLTAKEAVIDILAIRFEAGEDGSGTVVLSLAGGGAIALEVEAVNATLKDISSPWRTQNRPDHESAS